MYPLVLSTPWGFNLDLSFWQWLIFLPPYEAVGVITAVAGWIVLVLIFFYMGRELWLIYRGNKYTAQWKWALLAVDIPPMFVQTPKAIEQIFAHLSGARIQPNIGQKFWMGKKQKFFSLEIISIEGYIQFLIRTEAEFRDLVEAAVYAQYPEAEITEVEDYVNDIPSAYPNDTYDVFGVEFKLAENEAYPIRTYPDFEYTISKDVSYSDPLAAILENFTRIGKNENFWMQIVIEPFGNKWKEKGIALVKEIVANKKVPKTTVTNKAASLPLALVKTATDIWQWNFEPTEEEKKPEGKVQDLTPGAKSTVQAIEEKISKIGFRTKVRVLYSAKKDTYRPNRCIDGFVGALNQFHIVSRNAIVPSSATLAHYVFKQFRLSIIKNQMVSAFKKRKIKHGVSPYIMNIEELATLWHFPLPGVKAPLVQKTAMKLAEPPMNLPVDLLEGKSSPLKMKRVGEAPPEEKETEPPIPPPLEYA